MGDLLQVGQMAVQEGGSNGEKVGVARIINLHNAPWVLARADFATTNLNSVLGANNSKRHQTPEFSVFLDSVLVVLFDIIREVVDRDAVVLDILHDQLLRLGELGGGQGVGATDDGNDVDAGSQALHQLDIQLAETVSCVSGTQGQTVRSGYIPVASGCDEVEHGMDTVVPEPRVTLDTRLLGQNVVVLPLEEADDFREAGRRESVPKKGWRGWGMARSHLASLSTWSPKPGVSTIVREMRVPSSSSSSSVRSVSYQSRRSGNFIDVSYRRYRA